MVSSRVFLSNSLEQDLRILYDRLVVLGMEYSNSSVYLADMDSITKRTDEGKIAV
jgi:hypothetical protein